MRSQHLHGVNGGYQVCDKWLKDRKERCLELDDIRTYCRMVPAIGITLAVHGKDAQRHGDCSMMVLA